MQEFDGIRGIRSGAGRSRHLGVVFTFSIIVSVVAKPFAEHGHEFFASLLGDGLSAVVSGQRTECMSILKHFSKFQVHSPIGSPSQHFYERIEV